MEAYIVSAKKYSNMKKLSIFALFLLLVLPFACQKETILEENTINDELTIQEAKAWFETTIGTTSPNTRTAGAIAAFTAKDPLWQGATQTTLKNGRTGWLVPLKLKQLRSLSYRTSTKKDIKPNSVQETPMQFMFQFKEKGKIQLQVVEYLPEKAYLDKSKGLIDEKDFSGIVFVKTWEDKIIGGGHYLNGKRTSTFSPKIAGGRITATVCNDFVRIYFSNGCITGSNGELTTYGHNEVMEGCASEYSVNPQSIPTPPGHYWCAGWTMTDTECFNVCYDVPDPDPNPIVFPPGGGVPTTNPLFAPTFTRNDCLLLTFQNDYHREIVGLKLDDGRLLILPFINNDQYNAITQNQYGDLLTGNPLVTIFIENGQTKVDVYTYDIYGVGHLQGTYGVLEHIHTHPCLGNENIASTFDKNFATNRSIVGSDVKLNIYNCNGKVEYNANGEVKDASGFPKVTPLNCQ